MKKYGLFRDTNLKSIQGWNGLFQTIQVRDYVQFAPVRFPAHDQQKSIQSNFKYRWSLPGKVWCTVFCFPNSKSLAFQVSSSSAWGGALLTGRRFSYSRCLYFPIPNLQISLFQVSSSSVWGGAGLTGEQISLFQVFRIPNSKSSDFPIPGFIFIGVMRSRSDRETDIHIPGV